MGKAIPNCDRIIRNIHQGISGDCDADRKYLFRQIEKYQSHESAPEILRACGLLMWELL